MLERRPFVYPPVEVFRKLTPRQKQEFVEALKERLHLPIRDGTAGDPQSYELQRSSRDVQN